MHQIEDMQTPYPVAIEEQMQRYYRSLSEKDRRRYAAIEAVKLGHGGISYISRVLGCDYRTIKSGMQELSDEPLLHQTRIRQPGGGHKAALIRLRTWMKPFYESSPTIRRGRPWMTR